MGNKQKSSAKHNQYNNKHNDDDSNSNKSELLMPIKGLHDNLLQQRLNRDPMKYYEVITVLGVGSMGSVAKVKKRIEALGGSSREHFMRSEQPHLGERILMLGKLCCGNEEERDRTRDILHLPSSHSVYSANKSDSVSISSHGVSSMVTFGHHDTFLALKSISLEKTMSKALLDEMKNEVEILKKMDHPNIVRAMETYNYKHQIYIVMELCSGGDLYTRDPYSEEEAANITASILSAVAYMHSLDITHRDLKYENIVRSL